MSEDYEPMVAEVSATWQCHFCVALGTSPIRLLYPFEASKYRPAPPAGWRVVQERFLCCPAHAVRVTVDGQEVSEA